MTDSFRSHVVLSDDDGLYVEWESYDGRTQRVAVVECALCEGVEYQADAIPINDTQICGRCADVIMNLRHYQGSGRYVTWPNPEPERKTTTRKAISPTKRRNVYERDYYACRYCGARQNLVIDHVTPVSRGGRNTLDNLVTACAECNSRKHDRSPDEAGMILHPPHMFAPPEEGSSPDS